MKVAVYDTYVRKADGSGSHHFDIIVEKGRYEHAEIIGFGKKYLKAIEADILSFTVDECQFCHVETPTDEMLADIKSKGYYILEFDDIPAKLNDDATRTQIIQHIRAENKALRFGDFSKYSDSDLRNLLNKQEQQ